MTKNNNNNKEITDKNVAKLNGIKPPAFIIIGFCAICNSLIRLLRFLIVYKYHVTLVIESQNILL